MQPERRHWKQWVESFQRRQRPNDIFPAGSPRDRLESLDPQYGVGARPVTLERLLLPSKHLSHICPWGKILTTPK